MWLFKKKKSLEVIKEVPVEVIKEVPVEIEVMLKGAFPIVRSELNTLRKIANELDSFSQVLSKRHKNQLIKLKDQIEEIVENAKERVTEMKGGN